MKVEFRIAKEEDVESIIDLCNECFFENTSYGYAKKIFHETCDDKNQIYVIGLVDDKIISHAKITIIPTMYENMNTYAILNHVCVKEEYRRHKIATKLLDYITDICKNRNVKKLELWSNNVRVPAHSCYKNYGFVLEEAGFFSKEID